MERRCQLVFICGKKRDGRKIFLILNPSDSMGLESRQGLINEIPFVPFFKAGQGMDLDIEIIKKKLQRFYCGL